MVLALLVACALACGQSQAAAQQIPGYTHRHWDVEEGSPADIRAIAQTRDGFLWLGTSNGLYRFDGLAFEKVAPETFNQWRSNQITALAAAPDGALWVGYDFGGVGVFRDGRLRDANAERRPRGSVSDIIVARDGDVWVSVNGSAGSELRRLHQGRWQTYTRKDWLQPEPIQSIYQARDGTLWFAQFHSILRLAPGATHPEKIAEQVGFATSFAEDANGTLWLLSSIGLQRLSAPRSLIRFESDGPSAGGAGKRSLLFEDGLAWMAGHQEGIIRLSNLKTLPGGRDVIPVRSRVLFRDREGTIWGGGPDGLVNYIRSPVLKADLPGTPTTGFVAGPGTDAPTYLATDAGIYRLSGNGAQLVRKALYVTALCAGPNDVLLAPSLKRHQLKRGETWTSYAGPAGISGVSDCAIDPAGIAWVTVPSQGLFRLTDGTWQLQKGWPGAQLMLSDGKDGFYLSRPMHALLHATPGSVQTLWQDEQIKIGFIRVIKKLGNLLYLGGEKGLARYDGSRFVSLESRYNPWLSGISGIALGPQDAWLIGSEGIFRVARSDFDKAFDAPTAVLPHQMIGAGLGLNSRSFAYVTNDAAIDKAGYPWFATSRGVVRIDPARIVRNLVPPPVSIRSLEANGQIFAASNMTLPAGTTRVQFDYVALSLTDPGANSYRYKLGGIDENWVDAAGRRQATYTGVPPGTYRFQVIAANADGVWNKAGAVISVTILPFFWQTWWFKTALFLIFAVLLWALVQWRMRAASEATRVRIEDRLAVREHIAQELHDTLLQGVQGLVLRFQSILHRLPGDHPVRAEFETTLERADDVLQEGRDRVRYLREETEPVELAPMLSGIARQVLRTELRWAIRETGTPRPVCAPVADDISRIASEAMFNALRHAGAGMVSIRIANSRDGVAISISDDGVGIDEMVRRAGKKEGHYGLVHMRERSQRLGASFRISEARPHGTEISLAIPARIAYR